MWRTATEGETTAWLERGTPPGRRYRMIPAHLRRAPYALCLEVWEAAA